MTTQENIDKLFEIINEIKGYKKNKALDYLKNIISDLNIKELHILKLQSSRLKMNENTFTSMVEKMAMLLVIHDIARINIECLNPDFLKWICNHRKELRDKSVENITNINHAYNLYVMNYDKEPESLIELKETLINV